MSVRIQLDQHNGPYYTNLDFISGRVLLTLPGDATISAINVKLEAESRSRLSGPKDPNDRREKVKTELEVHKLLYKVETAFPGPDLIQQGLANAQYTLHAGQYEYPFRFKFPFNNDCSNTTSNVLRDLRFGQLNVQMGPDNTKHVKKALPPSLGGFPGEADITYFVKATVVRPKFYQENLRVQQTINFLPIEPPRPPDSKEETYARRQHQFQAFQSLPKKGLFKGVVQQTAAEHAPLSFKVDARLPNPAILTCHRPLPLRVLVERLNNSPAAIYLNMIQIELIGKTTVRAHDLNREESGSWVLVSMANLNTPLDVSSKKGSKEFSLPSRLWDTVVLPNTVIPSFETCNLSRRYEIEVRVGITHGMSDGVRPELIVLPLRLPVKIYSGIAPPPELLNRLQTGPVPTPMKPRPLRTSSMDYSPQTPGTPGTPYQEFTTPAPTGAYGIPDAFSDLNDAPPSYEDAIAEDIAPIDGPRRQSDTTGLNTPTRPLQPTFNSDVKSSEGLNRHPSERLFSQNAPSPPDSSPHTRRKPVAYRRSTIGSTFETEDLSLLKTDSKSDENQASMRLKNWTEALNKAQRYQKSPIVS